MNDTEKPKVVFLSYNGLNRPAMVMGVPLMLFCLWDFLPCLVVLDACLCGEFLDSYFLHYASCFCSLFASFVKMTQTLLVL